ncbi:DUF3558 family protein [Saccharopolyspora endophytica]|uniref:DUF3558 domain-containing protein n=1 Tax=Saccharopolyspora endophytica TaxID=543886 RepID=A0ABS5DLF7_9PSEU|nr:DUF3558 family protein [Saccharopolyspora endophytica]MBQ0927124.1 DUF3558 domain-containing protein [Saccharopolyspora endophytica]
MKAKMSLLKRGGAVAAGTVLTALLAACSGTGAESPAPQQPQPAGPQISNPKDVSSADLCSLLPPEVATSLGVAPAGQMDDGPKIGDSAEACVWRSPDGKDSVRLSVLTDRSIKTYYDSKSQYPDFQELTLADHPAVRANEGDPAKDGACSIFLGAADGQVVHSFATQTNITDPCALSQKALESSVPTWPAAK